MCVLHAQTGSCPLKSSRCMEARIGFRPSPPKTVSFLVSAGVLANDRHRRQMHLVTLHGKMGNALEEFEELRRLDDGIGNRCIFDQLLLSDLRAEVRAF